MITFNGEVSISLDDYELRRVVVGLSMYAQDMKKRADNIFDDLPQDEADRTMAINEADSFYSMATDVTKLIVKVTDDALTQSNQSQPDWN